MESVIPADVLAHIRALAERETSLDGKWTIRMLSESMGCHEDKARDFARELLRDGKIRPHRIGINDQQAWELGYLGGTVLRCYEWIDDPE